MLVKLLLIRVESESREEEDGIWPFPMGTVRERENNYFQFAAVHYP